MSKRGHSVDVHMCKLILDENVDSLKVYLDVVLLEPELKPVALDCLISHSRSHSDTVRKLVSMYISNYGSGSKNPILLDQELIVRAIYNLMSDSDLFDSVVYVCHRNASIELSWEIFAMTAIKECLRTNDIDRIAAIRKSKRWRDSNL